MQSQIEEIEGRCKAEVARLKSKFQTEIDELHLKLESLKKAKADLENQIKKLHAALKDLQDQLIEEQNIHEATRELLNAAEKRNGSNSIRFDEFSSDFLFCFSAVLRGEIEEIRILFERVSFSCSLRSV